MRSSSRGPSTARSRWSSRARRATARRLDVLGRILRQLGRAFGKQVTLYAEGGSDLPPILAYKWDEDRVVSLAHPWSGAASDGVVSYPVVVSIMGERVHAMAGRIGRARISAVLCVVLVLIAGIAGYRLGLARERHAAAAVVLTGTVTWSNDETRLIAFETDGVVRGPNDGDAIYAVIADNWQDSEGTYHSGGGYPTCLAAEDDSHVSMDHHRVELIVIDWDTGNGHPDHIAVRIHCLD